MKRKLLSILLSVAMLLVYIPTGIIPEGGILPVKAATSGTTGDCTWTLDGTILTISGNGAMGDYASPHNNVPSLPWGATITLVNIEDGVTDIGNWAFYNCTSLTSVTIPNSVTSIGSKAFYGCYSLEWVNITDIAAWCSISFADDDANPICYAKKLYLNGSLVTELVIPDGVTSIGSYAFYSCTSIVSVEIPDSVVQIGSYSLLIPALYNDSSYWDGDVFYIGNCLVYAKSSVSANYVVKPGTRTIAGGAFSNITTLRSVTIPDGVINIGNYAFQYCSSLTKVTLPDSIEYIGERAFIETALYKGASSYWEDNVLYIGNHLIRAKTALSGDCIIKTGTKTIADAAFSDCTLLNSVTLPNSIDCIPTSAFSNCSSLATVNIPDDISSIKKDAFLNCTALTSVSIPDSVVSVEENAFSGCTSLASLTIPDSVLDIKKEAFADCTSLKKVDIGEGVKEICAYAFRNCTTLEVVNYNAVNCEVMGGESNPVFEGCTALTTVNTGDKVQLIPPCAFYNSSTLTTVNISDSVAVVGNRSFFGCISLASVIIPDGVTTIASYAFYKCTSLREVNIGSRVTTIGNSAFFRTALTSLVIPDNVKTIKASAFSSCAELKSVVVGGGVTSIGNNAFVNCTTLIAVTIGKGVSNIGEAAFKGCSSLAKVYYAGLEREWENISIGENNTPLHIAKFYDIQDACTHPSWQPANCEAPKTCTACGLTDGVALGHFWQGATCTAPVGCSFCDLTRGEALGHNYVNGVCVRCQDTENKPSLTVVSTAAKAGETVTVTLAVQNAPAIKSLALTGFTYDAALLELVGGEWLLPDAVIANWDAAKQNAAIIFAENTALNTAVFTLTFRIKEGAVFATLPVTCQAVAKTVVDGTERDLPISVVGGEIAWGVRGNVDSDDTVDVDDAVYLLYHTLLPEQYPITQGGDMDRNGTVDGDDAIYLLYYCLLPDQYPLN